MEWCCFAAKKKKIISRYRRDSVEIVRKGNHEGSRKWLVNIASWREINSWPARWIRVSFVQQSRHSKGWHEVRGIVKRETPRWNTNSLGRDNLQGVERVSPFRRDAPVITTRVFSREIATKRGNFHSYRRSQAGMNPSLHPRIRTRPSETIEHNGVWNSLKARPGLRLVPRARASVPSKLLRSSSCGRRRDWKLNIARFDRYALYNLPSKTLNL